MDFYLDENLPKRVAWSLHALESETKNIPRIHNIFSIEEKFYKGITDVELIDKLKEVNGIWITHDYKVKTRQNEFQLLKKNKVTCFIISLPSGTNFDNTAKIILDRWWVIKEICSEKELPFICRIPIRGKYFFL